MRRRLPWLLALTALAATTASIVSAVRPATYAAQGSLILVLPGTADPPRAAALDAAQHVAPRVALQTYLDVARSEVLLRSVFPDLPLPAAKRAVRVTTLEDRGSALITISVRANDPSLAAERTSALRGALVAWDVHRAQVEAVAARDALRAQIETIEGRYNDVTFKEAQALGLVADARRADLAVVEGLIAAPASPLVTFGGVEVPEQAADRPIWVVAALAASLTLLAGAGVLAALSSFEEA